MALVYFVEDDQAIANIIDKTLKNAGIEGIGFSTGETFLDAFRKNKPDLICLDIMLPDYSGLDILKLIRKMDKEIPIMMISALQSEMDKVLALDLGADDYMTKPFGILELTSRIQAKLRKIQDNKRLQIENVIIDDRKHIVLVDDQEVYFTQKEYDILKMLMTYQHEVITKEQIFKAVWDTDFIGETRTLDMHIKSLRKKLSDFGAQISIKTVRSVGYHIQ
ncbi:MAG: response regulator transcription factor [Acholeplasmataceae bacterium]